MLEVEIAKRRKRENVGRKRTVEAVGSEAEGREGVESA